MKTPIYTEDIKPVSPSDLLKQHNEREIPNVVIEVWNKLIQENMWIQEPKVIKSSFKLEDLKSRMVEATELTRDICLDKFYFDLEDIFRKQGWKVIFNKASYNDSWGSYFVFIGEVNK